MKKLLLLLVFAGLTSASAFAQCGTSAQNIIEDFNTLPNPNDRSVLPDCWSVDGGSSQMDSGGILLALLGNSNPGTLITPNVENGEGAVTFRARKTSSYTVFLSVGYYSGGNFVSAVTYTLGGSFQTYTYDFANFQSKTSSSTNIAFKITSGPNSGVQRLLIDDVEYKSFCEPSSNPTAVAKDITVKLDTSGNVVVNPSQVNNGSTDSCGEPIVNFSLDKTLFTCDDLGTNPVVLTAEDSQGQTTTASANITVEPTVVFGLGSIILDEAGQFVLTNENAISASTTDCSVITYSLSKTTIDCSNTGTVAIDLIATYAEGSVTVSKNFGVFDTTDPVAKAQDLDVTISESTGIATITPQMADEGSSDNCGIASMVLSKTTFDCSNQGENTVELTVTDNSGRTNTTSFMVNVNSFIPEVVITSDNTTLCFDGENSSGATVSTDGSMIGVEYSLRKSADNSVIDGPIVGTGNGLSFNTGTVSENTTYHVFAEVPFSGKALSLPSGSNSSSDHLSVNAPGSFDYSTGYTIATWVKEKRGGISNSFDPIFYAGGTTGSDIEVYLNSNNGALTLVHNRGNGGTNNFLSTANNLLPDDQFAHLAVTFNGTTAKVFVNGVEKASKNIPAPLKSAGSELTFGYINNSAFPAFQSFGGSLDDLRIYDVARPVADIAGDMGRCLEGTETNLVLYYDLESISGTILTDKVNSTPAQLKNGGSLVDEGAISCSFTCNRTMSTEITVGDDEAPTATAKNISVEQGPNGVVTIEASEINNGSSDNCTTNENLVLSLDKDSFGCDDVGEHTVTLTVTDESGNSSTATSVVTVTTPISDQTVTAASNNVCPGSSTTISIDGSVIGISYSLRNELNEVIDGPIVGTGNAIEFNTGAVNSETTFNVFAEQEPAPDDAFKLGGSELVEIPSSSSLQLSENWTIEAWVKPSSTLMNIVETYDANGGFILRTNGSKWQAYAMRASFSSSILTSVTGVTTGEWTHVAATFNETTNQLKIYINGVLDASSNNASVDQRGSTTTIKLGARGDDKALQGEHQQDEVRIWNVERTAQEILDNKSLSLTGDETGLVAYYDFDDLTFVETGMMIPDKTSNNNDGAIVGNYTESNFVEGPLSELGTVCGFQMTEIQTITPADVENPTVVAQDISVRLDINNSVTILPVEVDNGSSDNCGIVSLKLELAPADAADDIIVPISEPSGLTFTEANLGANEVNLVVEDENGNVSSALATITVLEYKQEQTISFGELQGKNYGDAPFDLSATSNAGLEVSFSIVSGPATVSGNTLTITGSGAVIVKASQAGDDTYAPAEVEQTLQVSKAALILSADDKTITYGAALPTLTFTYDGFVNGEDESDLNATILISTTAGGEEGQGSAGTYPISLSISHSELGDNYSFMLIDATLTINKLNQTITLDPIEDKLPTDGPFDVVASVDTGLPLTYEVTGPASISGITITLDGNEGEVTLTVSQAGDINRSSVSTSISFDVSVPLAVGDLADKISIYPNPVSTYINIDIEENAEIRFFSIDGRLAKSLSKAKGKIDLNELRAGTYLLQVTVGEQTITKRIIKAN